MKKLLTIVFTMLLAGSLALARPGGDKARATADAQKKPKGNNAVQKVREAQKGHKGGKKSKKGGGATNPAPSPK